MALVLLGKKLGMTQVFQDNGQCVPVTVIEVGPCRISQVKTKEKDGYAAFQIGYCPKKEKRTSKALIGHFKKAGMDPMRHVCEIPVVEGEYKVGDELNLESFDLEKKVDVRGVTKGRGFTGVMKRWNFGGGRKSHGCEGHRRPGSIGQCATPARVMKGKKMAGHYGVENVTVKNLKIIKTLAEKNLMLVNGSIPGPNDGIVLVSQR